MKMHLLSLLALATMVISLQARTLTIKNTDKYPITVMWGERASVSQSGYTQRSEIIPAGDEKKISINEGPGRPFGSFKIAINQEYAHLNKSGINEFDLSKELQQSNITYLEIGAENLIKALLGVRVPIIKDSPQGTPKMKSIDIEKITGVSGVGFDRSVDL